MSSDPTAATIVSPIPLLGATAAAKAGDAESPALIQNDVFNNLVESTDDFLGLLSYSLYKRHKIEWMRAHPGEDFESFKRFACTATQVTMYKNEAEQMFKNIVDLTLEQCGHEMRESIQQDELVASIGRLRPSFGAKVGSHMLGGFCSVIVALMFYGVFALYSAYQESGGVEASAKKAVQSYIGADRPTEAPPEARPSVSSSPQTAP